MFDISKPHRLSPSATSRPVIVGHHPTMPDPMVTHEAAAPPKSAGGTPVRIKVEDGESETSLSLALTADDQKNKTVAPPKSAEETRPAIFTDALEAESRDNEPQPNISRPSATKPSMPPPEPPKPSPAAAAGSKSNLPKPTSGPAQAPPPAGQAGAVEAERHDLVGTRPLPIPKGAGPRAHGRQLAIWAISILLALLLVYVLLDAQVINNNLNLPVHFFKNT